MAERSGRGRRTDEPARPAPQHSAQLTASDFTHLASAQAAEAARLLRERGVDLLADQKARAATEIAHVGAAIHRAADKLHDQDSQVFAQYAQSAAEQLDRAAQYLQEHDLADIGLDVSALARRRPALVVGGLFLAGLAAARFVKSAQAAPPPGRSRASGDRSRN